MSTEHQQYSTENQADKIREYAARNNIEIVHTYADEGKSGLNIGGRLSLQQLIKDAESGTADFNLVLVYDVKASCAPEPIATAMKNLSKSCAISTNDAVTCRD
jgi:DNA invertase Pin-like site-specific DNA recombinase